MEGEKKNPLHIVHLCVISTLRMNITLSADEILVADVRAYARRNGTSLNQLVRDYLASLVDSGGRKKRQRLADEFMALAMNHAGRSPRDWRFNREEAQRKS